ncbi:expressed protein, partial [Aureococcus anophagefferens]
FLPLCARLSHGSAVPRVLPHDGPERARAVRRVPELRAALRHPRRRRRARRRHQARRRPRARARRRARRLRGLVQPQRAAPHLRRVGAARGHGAGERRPAAGPVALLRDPRLGQRRRRRPLRAAPPEGLPGRRGLQEGRLGHDALPLAPEDVDPRGPGARPLEIRRTARVVHGALQLAGQEKSDSSSLQRERLAAGGDARDVGQVGPRLRRRRPAALRAAAAAAAAGGGAAAGARRRGAAAGRRRPAAPGARRGGHLGRVRARAGGRRGAREPVLRHGVAAGVAVEDRLRGRRQEQPRERALRRPRRARRRRRLPVPRAVGTLPAPPPRPPNLRVYN